MITLETIVERLEALIPLYKANNLKIMVLNVFFKLINMKLLMISLYYEANYQLLESAFCISAFNGSAARFPLFVFLG